MRAFIKQWLQLILLIVCSLSPLPSWAQNPSQLQQQIRTNQAAIKAKKAKLKTVNEQHASLQKQLAQTEQEIHYLDQRIAANKSKIETLRHQVQQLGQEIIATEKDLERQQGFLERRLTQMYEYGQVSYVSILFQSYDITDFILQTEYLQNIVENDSLIIQKIRSLKEALDLKKKKVEESLKEVERIHKELQASLMEQQRLQSTQEKVLNSLIAQRASLSGELESLEHINAKMDQELRALIAARSSSSNIRGTGEFIYPVSGPITSPFGYRVHPIRGTTRLHTGIDFGVGSGTPIRAADSGTVIHSGWYGGYGNCVIIQHSASITSLYAHCSRLYVRQGQNVLRGDTISAVGSTGMSTGPHLHFEIRLNGNPINPMTKL